MQNDKPSAERTEDRIREALGLTQPWREKHARYNLDGALIDIEHSDGRADEVCRRTIRRDEEQAITFLKGLVLIGTIVAMARIGRSWL